MEHKTQSGILPTPRRAVLATEKITLPGAFLTLTWQSSTGEHVASIRMRVEAWRGLLQYRYLRRGQEEWLTRLRSLPPKALDALERELDGGSSVPAVVHVLRAVGMYGMLVPSGPTEIECAEIALQRGERASGGERQYWRPCEEEFSYSLLIYPVPGAFVRL